MPRKKKEEIPTIEPPVVAINEDFTVDFLASTIDDTTIVTSYSDTLAATIEKRMLSALNDYDPENKRYSAMLLDTSVEKSTVTTARLDELAKNPQSDLKAIQEINNIVRLFINSDDLIGRTYESIESNVNTTYRLAYVHNGVDDKKQKSNKLTKAKRTVSEFNKQINLERLIKTVIPVCYAEGNFVMYLRSVNDGYVVDSYPLGVAIVSDYQINGEPVIMIDIKELTNRLKKTMLKDKKGKPLFFESVEAEIEANYPPEVLQAYKDKENYAILDHNRAKIIRINNMNRKYGLSPVFRALKHALMLEQLANSDNINAKAKAKKIIFQKMRVEAMGADFTKKAFEDMAYAHNQLQRAFTQSTVLYTGIPQVEELSYIEPKTEMIPKETVTMYREKVMTTLGINFLDNQSQSVNSAKISIAQLVLFINSISKRLEHALEDWYRLVLDEQSIGAEFAPQITIIDSEMLQMEIRQALAKFMYGTLNLSRETTLDLIDVDLDDETAKRQKENEAGLSEVFTPYATSYTYSGDSGNGNGGGSGNGGSGGGGDGEGDGKVGRPKALEENDKQDYDEEYNRENR